MGQVSRVQNPWRTGGYALLGLCALSLAGDPATRAAGTTTIMGQDPLEVLSVKIKPNVFVILDTSGSMEETPRVGSPWGGDHPGSKLYQAKQVMKAVFQANATKAQFLFGVYRYSTAANTAANMHQMVNGIPDRFAYSTQSWAAGTFANPACTVDPTTCPTPNPANVTLGVQGPSGTMAGPTPTFPTGKELVLGNLYAYQWIQNTATVKNNTLVFTEATPAKTCTVTVAPGFYSTGAAAATAIQTAMNSCTGKANTYFVSYGNRGIPISSITRSGTVATVTTSVPHGFVTNDQIQIVVVSPAGWNGTKTITRTGASTFTFTVANSGATTATGATIAATTTYNANQFNFQSSGTTGYTLKWTAAANTMKDLIHVPVTITHNNGTTANRTATVTTVAPHNIVTGASVKIQGTNDDVWEGVRAVATAPTATTFTYAMTLYKDNRDNWVPTNTGTSTPTVVGVDAIITGTTVWEGEGRINLLQRSTTAFIKEWNDPGSPGPPVIPPSDTSYDPDGASTTLTPALDKPSPKRDVTTYFLYAQKLWNGETVYVDASGKACGIATGTATATPSVTLQLTTNCSSPATGADAINKVTFTWSGGRVNGAGTCQGFAQKVPLIPCDMVSPPQYDAIGPFLNNQLPLNSAGAITGYTEGPSGSGVVLTNPSPGGVIASSNTPLAQSLNDIRGIFANLWNVGQATPALNPIKNHRSPREKSIVLMVTDGDQNCTPFTLGMSTDDYTDVTDGDDAAALGAAAAAQKLYDPAANGTLSGATVNADGSIAGDAASSVQTYVIAFGAGASKSRADYIAWGGSGLKRTLGTHNSNDTWTTIPSATERADCVTCVDSFLAPDADTLKSVLQSVIDVGAQSGEFTAQQSVFGSIPEYVGLASTCSGASCSPGQDIFSIDYSDKAVRYGALVPTLISSSFSLPGFKGQLKAYQQDLATGNTVLRWEAGDRLRTSVTSGMTASCPAQVATGALASQCTFKQLHANQTDATIGTSTAAIKRRIYSTTRNGVFTSDGTNPYAAAALAQVNPPAPNRVALWPPSTALAPTDGTVGTFDAELGLPTTTATATADLAALQTTFKACLGSNLPTDCAGTDANKLKGARREARQMILAFLAGATPVLDAAGAPKRAKAAGTAGTNQYDLLFRARDWVLSESTQAAGALMVPPSYGDLPLVHSDEFKLFRDGYRDVLGLTVEPSDNQLLKGFALANPDDDKTNTHLLDPTLKPAMSVVFTPANDMLHAFRAAPSCLVTRVLPTACADMGGEELWGFLPYDQLGSIKKRIAAEPQGRDDHVYVMASSVRLGEVFVPGSLTITAAGKTKTVGGVWRKVLYVGRGIGGKYLTAIDVTGIGPYTRSRLSASPPIPLWSRGNPDTEDAAGVTNSHNVIDATAYSRMGQTWSVPAVVLVDPSYNPTVRRPNGVEHVLYVGSGYSNKATEGSTLFVLDAVTGDVVAAPDVGDRGDMTYENAIVANPAAFTPKHFTVLTPSNPSVGQATRVVFGDVHGRLWKILTKHPSVVVPVGDVGADQPLGTAVGLLGMDPYLNRADWLTKTAPTPYIYATSGNDLRATGPFKLFAFKDGGGDDATVPTGSATQNGVVVFTPAESLYAVQIAQGTPPASCGYTAENFFRGTVQPLTTFSCQGGISGSVCTGAMGNATFAATRLNLPLTKYAPPTPLACGNTSFEYPCRSSFDSILYSLHADAYVPSYDLTGDGSPDAYRVLNNTRIVSMQWVPSVEPSRTSSKLFIDNGLVGPTPPKPPKPGKPVIGVGHIAVFRGSMKGKTTDPTGQESAAFGPRFGSVVCHE